MNYAANKLKRVLPRPFPARELLLAFKQTKLIFGVSGGGTKGFPFLSHVLGSDPRRQTSSFSRPFFSSSSSSVFTFPVNCSRQHRVEQADEEEKQQTDSPPHHDLNFSLHGTVYVN
jgi:hypothetical protein